MVWHTVGGAVFVMLVWYDLLLEVYLGCVGVYVFHCLLFMVLMSVVSFMLSNMFLSS